MIDFFLLVTEHSEQSRPKLLPLPRRTSEPEGHSSREQSGPRAPRSQTQPTCLRASQGSETWADEVEQVEAECGCGLDKRGLARVFAIVNVMLGASMLIIPWAFAGSGLVVGTLMVFGVVSAEVPPA